MESVTVHDIPDGAQFVDVREADEYADGHAAVLSTFRSAN